jgi:pimeloyl-ACP methyl ester carboxylesterase
MSSQQSFELPPSPALPEVKYSSLGQLEVPYVEYGSPDSDELPIVLLHGISMPPDRFGRLPGELVKLGHSVLAVGVPEGKDKPPVSTMGWYAEKTKHVIREINGEQPYALAGLSWGGIRAQETAKRDRLVRGLVLAATLPRFVIPLDMPKLGAMKAVASTRRESDAAAAILGGDLGADEAEVLELMKREIHMGEHVRQMGAATLSLMSGSLGIRRAREIPTLFIVGKHDPLIPARSVAIGAKIMGAEVLTTDTGHAGIMTHPEESAAAMHEFLGRSR